MLALQGSSLFFHNQIISVLPVGLTSVFFLLVSGGKHSASVDICFKIKKLELKETEE